MLSILLGNIFVCVLNDIHTLHLSTLHVLTLSKQIYTVNFLSLIFNC